MNKFSLSLVILLLLFFGAGSVFAQQRTWKTYSPDNGAWSILAPGAMTPDAEAQAAESNKGSYSYNDFSGFFAVIYRDSPKRWVPWKADHTAYFRRVRRDVVKASKGKLLKEEKFTNGALVGREIQIKIQVGTMTNIEGLTKPRYRVQRIRMFFVGERFYMLLAVVPENEIDSPAINQYFDSFVVK